MTIEEFEEALENIEKTILHIDTCQKVLEFYRRLSKEDAEEYQSYIEYIEDYYNTYWKIENHKKDLENNAELNKDLNDAIRSSIEEIQDKEKIAFKLYYELNLIFAYNNKYLMTDEEEVAKSIYNQSPREVDLEKSEIICTTWAKIYASLLNQNGIDAIVNKEGIHYNVVFKIGSVIYTADAIEVNFSEKNQSYMNDMTRMKLGILPNALINYYYVQFVDGEPYEDYVSKIYSEMGIVLDEKSFGKSEFKKFQAIYDSQGSNSKEIFEIEESNAPTSIINKLSMIHTLIKNSDLTNIELIQYINNLIDIIFDEEEQKLISDITVTSKLSLEMHKIFAIGNSEIGYLYCIADNDGIKKVESVRLSQLLDEGTLIINNGDIERSIRAKHSKENWKAKIPGFNEDPDDKGGRD